MCPSSCTYVIMQLAMHGIIQYLLIGAHNPRTQWRTQHTGHERCTPPFRNPPWLERQKHQGFSLLGPYGKDWNCCGGPISNSSNAKWGALRTSATDKPKMLT